MDFALGGALAGRVLLGTLQSEPVLLLRRRLLLEVGLVRLPSHPTYQRRGVGMERLGWVLRRGLARFRFHLAFLFFLVRSLRLLLRIGRLLVLLEPRAAALDLLRVVDVLVPLRTASS